MLLAINIAGTRTLEGDPASFAGSVSLTADCSGGGVVNGGGTLIPSQTEDGIRLLANLTIVPEGCVETAAGRTFTLNGAPSLRETGTYIFSMPEEFAFVFDLNVSRVGTLAYEVRGKKRDLRSIGHSRVPVEPRRSFADGKCLGHAVRERRGSGPQRSADSRPVDAKSWPSRGCGQLTRSARQRSATVPGSAVRR